MRCSATAHPFPPAAGSGPERVPALVGSQTQRSFPFEADCTSAKSARFCSSRRWQPLENLQHLGLVLSLQERPADREPKRYVNLGRIHPIAPALRRTAAGEYGFGEERRLASEGRRARLGPSFESLSPLMTRNRKGAKVGAASDPGTRAESAQKPAIRGRWKIGDDSR